MRPDHSNESVRRELGRRLTLITTLVGLVAIGVLTFWQLRPDYISEAIGPAPLSFGNPASIVQVVAFLSPTCPHCAKFELTIGKDLYHEAEAGKLYYAVYPLMLETARESYTLALLCADQKGKLPAFLSLHYQNYYLAQHRGLRDLAEQVGIAPDDFTRCLNAPKTRRQMAAILRWTKYLGVEGTPTFFIKTDDQGFRKLQGNQRPKFWQRLLGAD